MSSVHKEVQKQIHQDWANREYIEVITASIKRITDFLNSFGKNLLKKPHKFLNLFNIMYPSRHVLPFPIGGSERETHNSRAENRFLGGVCHHRRNFSLIMSIHLFQPQNINLSILSISFLTWKYDQIKWLFNFSISKSVLQFEFVRTWEN